MVHRASSAGTLRRPVSRNEKPLLGVAAGLVIKPPTPPQREVFTSLRNGANAAAPCSADATAAFQMKSAPAIDQDAILPIEVRSLCGGLIANNNFYHSDCIMAVQEQVFIACEVPCCKQILIWEGRVLEPHCRLNDLSVPLEGAVFQLLIQEGPSDEELEVISKAKQVLAEGCTYLNGALNPTAYWSGLSAFNKGDIAHKLVCQATMQLLAGHTRCITINRNGIPKDDSWDSIAKMLRDPYFLEHVLDLPSLIERDKFNAKQVRACLTYLQDISGHSESDKITSLLNTGNTLAASLLGYVFAICKYFDMLSPVLQKLGADGLREVLDEHDKSNATADFPAQHFFITAYERFPQGQECSRDALVRMLTYQHAREGRITIQS